MNIYIPMHAFHPWVTLQRGSECICMYLIVSAVAALLQRCCRAVAALLQRCCSAVAPMLHGCCNAVASLWMAHKMLPPHLSSMRKITFKLLFSKKSSAAPKIYLEMMMIGWDLGRGGGFGLGRSKQPLTLATTICACHRCRAELYMIQTHVRCDQLAARYAATARAAVGQVCLVGGPPGRAGSMDLSGPQAH